LSRRRSDPQRGEAGFRPSRGEMIGRFEIGWPYPLEGETVLPAPAFAAVALQHPAMLAVPAEAVAGAVRSRDFLAVGKPHRRDERAAEADVADQVLAIELDKIERVRARRRLDSGEPDSGEQGPRREADRFDHAEKQG